MSVPLGSTQQVFPEHSPEQSPGRPIGKAYVVPAPWGSQPSGKWA